jgi:hypothetical protein
MRLGSISVCAILLVSIATKPVAATTARIDDFTKMADGVFVDIGSSAVLSPITVNGVTITPANNANGGYAGYLAGSPSDPGDGSGFLYSVPSAFHPPYLQIIFSPAVAAVGVTFRHFPYNPEPVAGSHSPAQLEAFTEPGLSGSLRVVSSSGFSFESATDFVGVWSDSANIRSIKLTGTNVSTPGFAVDGYAFSLTPPVAGDTNMDGKVDVTDLGNLATNYGLTSGAIWSYGDFNGDHAVNVTDLGDLATNYGYGTSTAPGAATSTAEVAATDFGELSRAVPEPTAGLIALPVVAWVISSRRSRTSKRGN